VICFSPAQPLSRNNKVIWRKDGPWSKQHDVDILDDHRISIFNNNGREFGAAARTAEMNIYHFATSEVTSPRRAALERLDVWAPEQGLAELLPNDERFPLRWLRRHVPRRKVAPAPGD
jgi:hypothetical protein